MQDATFKALPRKEEHRDDCSTDKTLEGRGEGRHQEEHEPKLRLMLVKPPFANVCYACVPRLGVQKFYP
jgi:hypothetical protein